MSHERSVTVGIDGRYYVVRGVDADRRLPPRELVTRALIGPFQTLNEANTAAAARSRSFDAPTYTLIPPKAPSGYTLLPPTEAATPAPSQPSWLARQARYLFAPQDVTWRAIQPEGIMTGPTGAPQLQSGRPLQTFRAPGVVELALETLPRLFAEGIYAGSPAALPVAGLTRPAVRRLVPVPTPRVVGAPVAPPVVSPPPAPVDVLGTRLATMRRTQGGLLLDRPAPLPGPRPLPGTSPPAALTQPVLSQATHQRVLKAAGDLFETSGVQRDPSMLLSDQVMQLVAQEKVALPAVEQVLKRHGLTFTQFAEEAFRPAVTDAARRLSSLSALSRRIADLAEAAGPEGRAAAARVRELGTEAADLLANRSIGKRLANIWRGSLVVQPATAARNFATQVGRLGMDTLQQGMDRAIQTVLRVPKAQRSSPAEGLEALGNLFASIGSRANRAKAMQTVDALLAEAPKLKDRLFQQYVSDVAVATRTGAIEGAADRVLTSAEGAVSALNILNRTQEWIVRRAVFQSHLAQRLRQKGQDLVQTIEQNRMGSIAADDLEAAVQKSLELSFASQPVRGSVGERFLRLVNHPKVSPLIVTGLPFPRFMVNALQFYADFSPFGFLKLLSPVQRAAMAAGNTQVLSRAVMGTAMLGAAAAMRTSEYAGEKWYEARVGGKTFDLRPFNPFGAYLFLGDVVARRVKGVPKSYSSDEILAALGVLTGQAKAGTGLYLLDRTVDAIMGQGKRDPATLAKQFAGAALGGLATFLQPVQDVLGEFITSQRTVRETREDPLLGPARAKIPFLSAGLPEAESPTRAGPIMREQPLLRQLAGLTVVPEKNPAETELDRLGFTRREILPSTGDVTADRLVAKHLGPLVERYLIPFVEGPAYRRLSDAQKANILAARLTNLRETARAKARAEDPRRFRYLQFRAKPERERRVLEERGYAVPAPGR